MTAVSFSLVLVGVLLNAAAQLLLKAGTNAVGAFEFSVASALPAGWKLATQPAIAGGLACYVVSVVVWIMALSRTEVSIAYPMLSIGYVVNALIAWWFMGEALTATKIAGIATICFGVWLLARA